LEIEDLCKAKTKTSTRGGVEAGHPTEMSLTGLGKKKFPFTVARYDEQRVGEQKGKG
jgi:hypothetical protein